MQDPSPFAEILKQTFHGHPRRMFSRLGLDAKSVRFWIGVRSMNPQPQPRIILVLRHLESLCVSPGPECPASLLSSLYQRPQWCYTALFVRKLARELST